MFVIGIAGQAQMGKDTLADRLAIKLNETVQAFSESQQTPYTDDMGWQRTAFAKNVKRVFSETFGVDYDFIEEWKVKSDPPPSFGKNVRQSLQFIGDGFRSIQDTIWVDLCFRNPLLAQIISDVRYPNEFLRVHKEGGLNIIVGRTEKLNDDSNSSESLIRPYVEWFLNHTEGDVVKVQDLDLKDAPKDSDKFHLFVRNDGSKSNFYLNIDTEVLQFVKDFVFDCTQDLIPNQLLFSLHCAKQENQVLQSENTAQLEE